MVIAADDGELFGEYGRLGHHMVLHDGLIHVPMITHGLEGVAHHSENPTQHIDIMQTLLSVAGVDTLQFQGYDIREHSREMAISQDLRGSVDDPDRESYELIRTHNPEIDLSHLPESMATAVRTTEFKLVQTDEWSKLYQLPDETNHVQNAYPSVFDDLKSFLHEWLTTDGTPFEDAPEETELSEDTEQHLQDLGYM